MKGRGTSRRVFGLAVLAIAALAFGGCDWTTFGYDAALTHSSADTAMNSANVSTVKQLFTASGAYSSPVESGGVVYAGGQRGNLYAFDANGVTSCSGSPNLCNPLWSGATGPIASGAPAVANGVVYVVSDSSSTSPSTLYAFDAKGATNCSGSPKVCQPLWTAPTTGSAGTSPNVISGIVYIGGSSVEAFDANGVTDCSGTPKVCQPLWTSASNASFNSPAVANGVLYATGDSTGNDKVFAYSANGTTNCSGTPTMCQPLWTATMGTTSSTSAPAVANGVVYAESNDAKLFAFDAGGVTGCSGTPKACGPLWAAALNGSPQFGSSPAVANGVVYAPSSTLQAFDANGVTNCSGTPKACAPLWSYNVSVYAASPAVANGLVFIGSLSGSQSGGFNFMAFDAKGNVGCAGTPHACNPLWTGVASGVLAYSPAVANGKVYVADSSFSLGLATHLYAWVLPPPTTFVTVPSNNSTVSGNGALDAGASSGVTQVQFELTGGSLNHFVIATGKASVYGWTAPWNTASVPNGVYTLQSVASYGGEVSGTSAGITITVSN